MTYLEFLRRTKSKLRTPDKPWGPGSSRKMTGICRASHLAAEKLVYPAKLEYVERLFGDLHAAMLELDPDTLGPGEDFYTTALVRGGKIPANFTMSEAQAARHALLDRFIAEEQHENHSDN